MANEITLTASLSGYKAAVMGTAKAMSVPSLLASMSGNAVIEGVVSIATSATVIPLGGVTAPHWAAFHNTDTVNFLKIRNGASGADLIKLLAGEWAFVPLLDSSTPYAIADTGACLLEYLIFSL